MSIDSLEVRLGISGEAAVVSGLKRVRAAEDEAAGGAEQVATKFAGMEIPALRAITAMSGMATAIGTVVAAMTTLSGVKLAAQYERIEVGLTTMLKSAAGARELMSSLQSLGAASDFDVLQLTQFARALIATDSSANKALNTLRTLQAVVDTVAATGGSTADVGEVVHRMGAMRTAPRIDMEQVKSLQLHGINIADTYNAATGQNASPQIAMARLQNMRGQEAFDTLIKGMEKLYGGSAAKNAATGLGLVQNIMETLGNIFIPTGRLLLAVLEPLGSALLGFLTGLKKFNDLTNGFGGLAVLVILVARGWNIMAIAVKAAYHGVLELTAAIERLAVSSTVAATKVPIAAAAGTGAVAAAAGAQGAGGGAAAAGGGAAAAASGATGIKLLWQALKGGGLPAVMTELKAMLGGVGKFMKSPGGAGIAGLGATIIGGQMQQSQNPGVKNTGDYVANVGTGMSIASLVAALLPISPALKLAAVAIGGAAGGLKTWWDKAHPEQAGGEDVQAKQLHVLRDIHSTLIGGGDRAQRVKSEVEAEYSLRRAVFKGVG